MAAEGVPPSNSWVGGKEENQPHARPVLLTGDTLFADTVGRSDLPGSNPRALLASLAMLKNYGFPPDTLVVPGHGQTATWSEILKTNPYMK